MHSYLLLLLLLQNTSLADASLHRKQTTKESALDFVISPQFWNLEKDRSSGDLRGHALTKELIARTL